MANHLYYSLLSWRIKENLTLLVVAKFKRKEIFSKHGKYMFYFLYWDSPLWAPLTGEPFDDGSRRWEW